ncbi:MAG: GTPase domain-containing protein [Treponema sp.]|nr:GTPase domain-containing protein [Treponema sp.]
MRKNIRCAALIFSLLLVMASNQTVYAQAETQDEVSVSSKPGLNYSEMNALIDKVIFQKLNNVIQLIKKYLLIVWAFFLTWPSLIKNVIAISFFPACVGIISSHVIGIYRNRNEWHKNPNCNLMYSYFTKSGTLQRKKSYTDAHSLLRDHKWSWASFAGLAFRLGNYAGKSAMLMFVMTFAYIPLTIFGFIEMALRISLGTVWLLAFNMLHRLTLFVTKLVTYLLIPVSYTIDKIIRKTQYCPHCYETFFLPEFICPFCGRVHKQLVSGSCGVLFVRCACNKIFLPCASFTGRSRLASKCPSCAGELAAANAKHFSIMVVGGNNAGKTAFIAALANLYAALAEHKGILIIEGKPDSYFNQLNDMFRYGKTAADDESRTYSIIHKYGKIDKDNLVLYDTPAKYVVSDTFPRSPKYFRFCDGIILLLDPLSVRSVQKELVRNEDNTETNYLFDDTNNLVVQFIHQYNTICGRSTGVMNNIPVAVLINKVDIEIVKREIGWDTIHALYDENPSAYNNNEYAAKDQICREYLAKAGLRNVLNNIDSIFTNVSFFPVSAIGHKAEKGKAFTPIGVMEPVAWIAKKRHSRLTSLLLSGENHLNNKR